MPSLKVTKNTDHPFYVLFSPTWFFTIVYLLEFLIFFIAFVLNLVYVVILSGLFLGVIMVVFFLAEHYLGKSVQAVIKEKMPMCRTNVEFCLPKFYRWIINIDKLRVDKYDF